MSKEDLTGELLRGEAPVVTDLSREVLTTIFGGNWWNLTEQGSAEGIFELLLMLNAICAVVIAWLMILTLVISSTGAAQEGRALGGKYLNPWVPLRFAFAMAAGTPVRHGRCAMQVILLSCVGVSINMANAMLDTALAWVEKNSTLVAVETSSAADDFALVQGRLDVGGDVTGASKTGGKTLAVQILENEAFLIYLHSQLGCNTPASGFAKALSEEENPETGDITLYFSQDGQMECMRGSVQKNRAVFGGFVIRQNQANDVTTPLPIKERVKLLKELIDQVERTGAPAHFAVLKMQAAEMARVVEDRALVQAEGVLYASKLATLVRGQGQRSEALQARLKSFVANAHSLGWFGLGSQYWTLATLEQELESADNVHVSWLRPRYRSFAEILPASFATTFWPRINEASYLGDHPSDSILGKIVDYLSPLTGITKRFAYALGESHDALLAMVHLARWVSGVCSSVLVAAETAKLAAIGGSKLLTRNVVSRVGDFFTGGGEASDSVVKTLIQDVSFFLNAIVLPLWAFSTFV
ncbi:MAG: DotA/TraY family protein, partial [Desulfovibrio sp.]|nr:DotA/TraY family protein [Desulfovibrio sp.]